MRTINKVTKTIYDSVKCWYSTEGKKLRGKGKEWKEIDCLAKTKFGFGKTTLRWIRNTPNYAVYRKKALNKAPENHRTPRFIETKPKFPPQDPTCIILPLDGIPRHRGLDNLAAIVLTLVGGVAVGLAVAWALRVLGV